MGRSERLSRVLAALVGAGALLLALTVAVSAFAQDGAAGTVASGEVEIGYQGITGSDTDSAARTEYRDDDAGIEADMRLSVEEDGKYFLESRATDIAQDDQSFGLRIGRYGRYRLELEYDELPHIFSTSQQTIYVKPVPGFFALDDSRQNAVEAAGGANAPNSALQAAYPTFPVTLRTDVQTARVGLFYRPTVPLELDVTYRFQRNRGTRAWGMGFGSPGGDFTNVAADVDELTHEVTAGVNLSRGEWTLRLQYTGSFYDNDVDTIVIDNPVAGPPDAAAGPSQGRADNAPDNSAHTFTLSGATDLPTGFPLRLSAALSYGLRYQDDPFIPHTINTAISDPALALPASDLDGEVQTLLGFLRLAGRPAPRLGVTGFYRYYDHDNRSRALLFPGHVVNDQSLVVENRHAEGQDYTKHNLGIGASYVVARPLTARLGVEWERWDRSEGREVQESDEYITKLGFDIKPSAALMLKTNLKFAVRTGSAYDTFAHLAHTVDEADFPGAIPQFQTPLLRKYDEANRKLYQADVLARLNPRDDLEVSLMGGYALTDYDDTELGLTDHEAWNAGTDLTVTPRPWVALSTFYMFEHARYDQRSRWRSVSAGLVTDDPINNWSSSQIDKVHTAGVSADFKVIANRLDATLAYLFEHANTETQNASIPGTTGPASDGGNAPDWPGTRDTLQRLLAQLRYYVTRNFTIKGTYRYEDFDLTNFRTDDLAVFMPSSNINGSGTIGQSQDVFLANRQEDYTAHIFEIALAYRF